MKDWHRANFDTLCRGAISGDLALMECKDAKTGAPVVVICAVNTPDEDGMIALAPLAKMFDGNPYDEVVPADAESVEVREDVKN